MNPDLYSPHISLHLFLAENIDGWLLAALLLFAGLGATVLALVCKYFMTKGDTLGEAMRRITSKRQVAIMAGLQEALDFK